MSTFDDRQRAYALTELNRTIPVAQDIPTIQAALETAGSGMVSPLFSAAAFGGSGGGDALQRDANCRALPTPSRQDAGARAGCGWWYVADPATPSVGAYGTRRGPMNPALPDGGEWIWDVATAMQKESSKAAAQVQSCTDIQYAQKQWPNLGWCTQTGCAIMTNGKGAPLYPRATGGDCAQGSIVTQANACPAPAVPGSGGGGGGAGSGGVPSACSAGGPLTPACLGALATYSCGGNGALAQAYAGGGWPAQNDQISATNQILMQRGFTLPTGVLQDGQIAVQDALTAFSALKSATADTSLGPRAQGAAANLCMGTAFNPCAFQPTDTGPFPATCITQTAQGMGYAANAGLLPQNAGMSYWDALSGVWSDVVSNLTWWKQTADTPQPQQPALQAQAMGNVYGVTMKFPQQGCNVSGAMIYRYYFPPGAVNYMPGAQGQTAGSQGPPPVVTHFLGRYLLTEGLDQGVPNNMNEMTPGHDRLTEIKRMQFSWTPAQGGIYRFLVAADDSVYIYFNNQLFQSVQSSTGTLSQPTDAIVPGTPITAQIDAINMSGAWNYQFTPQVSTDGGNTFQNAPLTLTQMNMLYDRRLPMLEWAFHRMQPTTYTASQLAAGVPITDTNGVMSQMSLMANIGQLAGRPCLVIGGAGQGLFNYGQSTLQGMRLMAMKSFTMMLCITGTQQGSSGIAPSVLSLFNLTTSRVRGSPNPGAWSPQFVQPYTSRVNSFDIAAQQSTVFPFGMGSLRGTSVPAQTYFLEAVTSGDSITSYMPAQWFHYAWVWDADGSGYTIYQNGKQVGRGFMPPYDPQLIMEMFRLGCDQSADGNGWTGGIQWFRAFDYQLSATQVTTDMQDGWAQLVSG